MGGKGVYFVCGEEIMMARELEGCKRRGSICDPVFTPLQRPLGRGWFSGRGQGEFRGCAGGTRRANPGQVSDLAVEMMGSVGRTWVEGLKKTC